MKIVENFNHDSTISIMRVYLTFFLEPQTESSLDNKTVTPDPGMIIVKYMQ